MSCPVCQYRIAPGSVIVTGPGRHPSNGAPIVGLAFSCPHCDRVPHWSEWATASGKPNGIVAVEPDYLDDEAAEQLRAIYADRMPDHPAS